jgi:hypothetical protein
MSSFLNGLKSIADELEAEGHALAAKASGLFGEAEKIVSGLAGELTPALDAIKAQLTADGVALSAEALGDVKTLVGEGTADLKTEFEALKTALEAFLGQAPAAPVAEPTDVPAAE